MAGVSISDRTGMGRRQPMAQPMPLVRSPPRTRGRRCGPPLPLQTLGRLPMGQEHWRTEDGHRGVGVATPPVPVRTSPHEG